MPDRHLLVIPLPHGRTANRGRLTVYFSPRLRDRGRLFEYPEWRHWADTVNTGLAIGVEVNGVPLAPGRITRVTPLAEPAVWDAVFDRDTPVSAYRPTDWRRQSQDHLLVGPGGDFSEAVLRLYAGFAESFPDGPPPGDAVLGLEAAEVLTSSGADAAREFIRPIDDGERIDEARDHEWDFHEYVSILGHHPALLRLLGLAVELEIDLPASPTSVRVHTDYDTGATRRAVDFRMETTPDFWARPNPDPKFTEQEAGFLRLTNPKPELAGFLSILDTASTADRLRDLDQRLPGRGGALPSLTTRALTLVRPDLVNAFRNRTERQWTIEEDIDAALNAAQPIPVQIFAEDVARGHRIDVFEPASKSPTWRSLFERETDDTGYQFPRDPALDRIPDPDEGWTSTKLVTEVVEQFAEPNPDRNDPNVPKAVRRIDDQLYRWDGWSGAVRPPGHAAAGTTGQVAPDQPTTPPVDDDVQFATHYDVVPESLPRLRFGVDYLMRARCVDLTGDSSPLDAPAPSSALPPVETFGRLEPISAPYVVRRTPHPVPGLGDAATTVVLLSDYDIDDADVEAGERLLFPGRVGQDLCELHGVPEGGVDADSYADLAARDARHPDDPWIEDLVTGEPVATGAACQAVEYLSDPLIGRLRAHHHALGSIDLIDLAGEWPTVSSGRIEVIAGASSTEVDPAEETNLRVAVAKADIDTVELSYAPAEGGVERFGLWHQLDSDAQKSLGSTISDGGHWMFSARIPLTMVHAVRRPLLAPGVVDWEASRGDRSTGVTFSTDISIDRRSTERLTLTARWTDLVDDLREAAPVLRASGASLGNFSTPRDTAAEPHFLISDHRAELGDTRRHAAKIDLEAFSFFSRFFTEQRTITVATRPMVVDGRGFARGSVTVVLDDRSSATEGVDYAVSEPDGVLLDLPGGRVVPGGKVVVRYIPLPVSRTSDENEIVFETVFPSTAPPPPPQIVEVVPAFARSRTIGGDDGQTPEQVVHHDGNVVRVYFARPWNVSGDGESVAVLVEREPGSNGTPATTCVSRDPIVEGTTTPLSAAAFTRATSTVASADGVVDLVIHAVSYDGETRRWFTDIAVDTPMYRPFLRLAIARHQLDSVPGAELSSVVLTDPIRLGVNRTVTVRDIGGDEVDVVVTGPDHGGMASDGATNDLLVNDLVAIHQRADSTIDDKDLRWRVDVSTTSLDHAADGGVGTWSATVAVPSDGSPGRLVIEEREPALLGGDVPTVGDEVVYTDTVELAVQAAERIGASPSSTR